MFSAYCFTYSKIDDLGYISVSTLSFLLFFFFFLFWSRPSDIERNFNIARFEESFPG